MGNRAPESFTNIIEIVCVCGKQPQKRVLFQLRNIQNNHPTVFFQFLRQFMTANYRLGKTLDVLIKKNQRRNKGSFGCLLLNRYADDRAALTVLTLD